MQDWMIITWVAAALVAITSPVSRSALRLWRNMALLARRPLAAGACVGIFALGVGSLPTLMGRTPVPFVHDEFAHLLAADTFLHGRLTNPTPAMWEHFETFYELMQPSYMSIYLPGQGLALALGTLLHVPILGSFGIVALACVATYWMLLAWLPRRWALLGGMMAATHPEIFNLGQGYWTGGISMLGGALLGGATARLMTQPRRISARHGAIAGLGVALMAIHRPFEGLTTIALTAAAAGLVARRKSLVLRACLRAALPAALVILPAATWLGYYNWRITGHPTTLPYFLYEKQYAVAPAFYWMPVYPMPAYRHEDLREVLVDFYYRSYLRLGTVGGFAKETFRLLSGILAEGFNPWLLAAPAVLALFPIGAIGGQRRKFMFVAVVVSAGAVIIHLASCPYLVLHYIQSAVPMFIAWNVLSLRQVASWRPGGRMVGRTLVIAVIAAQVAALGTMVGVRIFRTTAPGETRQRLVNQLDGLPGKQLVLVNYTPGSQLQTLFEWVYNAADPDQAKIVWARSMGPAKDRELLEYYRNRKLWMLDVNGTHLSFYPANGP